jgi:hypothetical protein
MKIAIVGVPEKSSMVRMLNQVGLTDVRFLPGTYTDITKFADLWVYYVAGCSDEAIKALNDYADQGNHVFASTHPLDVVDDIIQFTQSLKRAKKLREAILDSSSPEADRKRLMEAIRKVGFYHPSFAYTPEHVKTLASIGVVKSVEEAVAALESTQYIPKSRWLNAWKLFSTDADINLHPYWIVSGPTGKQVKSCQTFLTRQRMTKEKLKKVAEILKLHETEPDTGSRIASPPRVVAAFARATPSRKPMEPVKDPVVEIVAAPVPEPEPVVAPEPSPTSISEMIRNLNAALVKANVRSFTLSTSESGTPTYEFEQVQIRKLTSLDDLI